MAMYHSTHILGTTIYWVLLYIGYKPSKIPKILNIVHFNKGVQLEDFTSM